MEAFRIRFLGTKGLVKNLMGEMKEVPAEQRKAFGQVLNDFKQFAETKLEELKSRSKTDITARQKERSGNGPEPAR